MTTASETPVVQHVSPPAPPSPLPQPGAVPDPVTAPTEPAAETPVAPPAPQPEPAPTPDPGSVVSGWVHPEGWAYGWLDYRGDRLAVRIPNKSAIHAIANLKYSSIEFQQQLIHRFLDKHLSPESYQRVCDRMVDPDDDGYATIPANTDPLGEILRDLMRVGGERVAAQAKALAETTG